MHMADALLSPPVGGAMGCISMAALAYCSNRMRDDPDDRRIPLMGVLGAFLFAAQMINFAIPGTGASGHLGGGLLLAILLGPHPAFLVVASVLIVQALFFADGGLLALGCNVFNLAFFPAFVGYPIYRLLCGPSPGTTRTATAATIAAVVSMECGAVAVVLETVASGISALPLRTFLLFMLPIHLAIGVVEGLVTAAIVGFVRSARPDAAAVPATNTLRPTVFAAFLCVAVALGGVGAWFASARPDGLEWSVAQVTGQSELRARPDGVHGALARMQSAVAVLPDYDFPRDDGGAATATTARSELAGTSASGLAGGALALVLAVLAGLALRRRAPTRA